MRRLLVVSLTCLLASCGQPGRMSLTEAEAQFHADRTAFESIAESARSRWDDQVDILARDHPAFSHLPNSVRFERVRPYGFRESTHGVEIVLAYYGLAVSGRTVGLVHLPSEALELEDTDDQRLFGSCSDAQTWMQTHHASLQIAYCPIADGWYAFQISN